MKPSTRSILMYETEFTHNGINAVMVASVVSVPFPISVSVTNFSSTFFGRPAVIWEKRMEYISKSNRKKQHYPEYIFQKILIMSKKYIGILANKRNKENSQLANVSQVSLWRRFDHRLTTNTPWFSPDTWSPLYLGLCNGNPGPDPSRDLCHDPCLGHGHDPSRDPDLCPCCPGPSPFPSLALCNSFLLGQKGKRKFQHKS